VHETSRDTTGDREPLEWTAEMQDAFEALDEPRLLLRVAPNDAGGDDFVCYAATRVAVKAFGGGTPAVIGRHLSSLLPAIAESPLWDQLHRLMNHGEPVDAEEPVRVVEVTDPASALGEQRLYDLNVLRFGATLSFGWQDVTERRRAEQRVAVSEKHYRMLAENTTDIVVLTDAELRCRWVSPSVTEVLGHAPEDLIGLTAKDLIHPEDFQRARSDDGVVAERHSWGLGWLRYRCSDGSYRLLSGRYRRILGDDGTVDAVLGVLHDVEELAQAQESLRASEERLRGVLDALVDPHILLEAVRDGAGDVVDFTVIESNPAAQAEHPGERSTLGTRLSQQEGVHLWSLIPVIARVVETDTRLVADDVFVTGHVIGGEDRWVDVRVTKVGDGAAITWRNVSDRHESAAALARSEELARLALDGAPIGTALVSAEGNFLRVNQAMCDFFGYDAATLMSLTWQELTHPADLAADVALVERLIAGEIERYQFTKRYVRSDGEVVIGDLAASAVHDPDGSLAYLVGQVIDVTETADTSQQLRRSERQYRAIAENASDVVARLDTSGACLWVSPSSQRLLGRPPESLVGERLLDVAEVGDLSTLDAWWDQVRNGADPAPVECRFRSGDGQTRWMALSARLAEQVEEKGSPRRATEVVVTMRDCDAEVAARQAVEESEQRFRLLADHTNDMVLRVDVGGTCAWVSPSLERSLGWTAQELVGTKVAALIHPVSRGAAEAATEEVRSGHSGVGGKVQVLTRKGRYRWLHTSVRPEYDSAGQVTGAVVTLADVDDEVRALEALERAAGRDPLTGLANAAMAREEMDRAVASVRHSGRLAAAVVMDIDRFSTVNDALGTQGADAVLVAVADRLTRAARAQDVVARLGGDEFVVVMRDLEDGLQAVEVANSLYAVMEEPFSTAAGSVACAASVGVGLARRSTPGGGDILAEASAALFSAKNNGRGRVEWFDRELRELAEAWRERTAAFPADIVSGAAATRFALEVTQASGNVIGAVATAAWTPRPELPSVSHPEVERLAFATGTSAQLVGFLARAALQAAAATSGLQLQVAVPVSERALRFGGTAEAVSQALGDAGADPAMLRIALPEGAVWGADDALTAELRALCDVGVRLAVYEYSQSADQLAALGDLPVDAVGVRARLLRGGQLVASRRWASSVVRAATDLGMYVIADGVSGPDDLVGVRRVGIRSVNGPLVGMAADIDELVELARLGVSLD
jgi:diguanylate cyclase (GGDEF)-like protein/PAS domain S-box-containing protein